MPSWFNMRLRNPTQSHWWRKEAVLIGFQLLDVKANMRAAPLNPWLDIQWVVLLGKLKRAILLSEVAWVITPIRWLQQQKCGRKSFQLGRMMKQRHLSIQQTNIEIQSFRNLKAPKTKKIPDTISKAKYDSHMLNHVPLRNCCEHCMARKVHEDAHPRRAKGDEAQEVPRVSFDF